MPGIDDTLPGAAENGLQLSTKKTVTGAAGAASHSANAGIVTTESLTTAAGGVQQYVITNPKIKASSIVLVSVGNGTNSQGRPTVCDVTPANGSVTINLQNIHASQALNGTLKLMYTIA